MQKNKSIYTLRKNIFDNIMKIATWNVNSIRARIVNFLEFIKEFKPDVVLIQELKCVNDQFPFLELESMNYNIEVCGEKARNGVAILSKFPLYDVKKELPLYGITDSDNEARYIEANIDYDGKVIKLASIYVPNGGPSADDVRNGIKDETTTNNFYKKMKFLDRLKIKFQETIKNEEIAFFGGDYNICPNLNMDVYSVEKDGVITCTQKERDKFAELLSTGMIDIWRKLNPDLKEYSWWGYRPFYMWEKNLGYRLDAFLITPITEKLVKNCTIYAKETRPKEKASDHVPMMCEI